MRKFISYVAAIIVGLSAIYPPMNYDIPLLINSFSWLYLVLAAALLGYFLWAQDIHISLKLLSSYMFINCFFSQAPALSFNNYILTVGVFYFFILLKHADKNILLKMVAAVFWLQITIAFLQIFNMDKLLNFGSAMRLDENLNIVAVAQGMPHPEKYVFFGSVFQYMRFGSLLAVMAPSLVLLNAWYLIPLFILIFISTSLSFALSIVAGCVTWLLLTMKYGSLLTRRAFIIFCGLLLFFSLVCGYQSRGHIHTEIDNGRLPVWGDIVRTWAQDTRLAKPAHLTGPVSMKTILIGHGSETFDSMFPFYKHDRNPFPQAHNDWLELLWCLGLIGFLLVLWYVAYLVWNLLAYELFRYLSGLVSIGVVMFFCFPWHMLQTILLMVTYVAVCENAIQRRKYGSD